MHFTPFCPTWGTGVGRRHANNCDVERCSYCHCHRALCTCCHHNPDKTIWTGLRPRRTARPYEREKRYRPFSRTANAQYVAAQGMFAAMLEYVPLEAVWVWRHPEGCWQFGIEFEQIDSSDELTVTQAENGIMIMLAGVISWWPERDFPWRLLHPHEIAAFYSLLMPRATGGDLQLLKPLKRRVKAMLRDHRDTLETLTQLLLERPCLFRSDIEAVIAEPSESHHLLETLAGMEA